MLDWDLVKGYVTDHELPIIPLCPGDHSGMDEKHIERCKSPGKAPVLFKWSERKRTTLGEVKTWSVQNKNYNIGLILGETENWNIIGIDIDGKEGLKRWEELIEEHGDTPLTWEFTTPSGGMRLLYSLPMGVKTKKSKDAAPLDGQHQEVAFICQGQQTVLPPSTIGKKSYAWAEGGAPWDGDIAQAPQWIVDIVQVSDEGFFGDTTFDFSEPVTGNECEGLTEGQGRNNAMTRTAGSYASIQNMTLDKLLMLCRKDNESMATPLDDTELETTVNSVWNSELRKRQDVEEKNKAKEAVSEQALGKSFIKGKFEEGVLFRFRNDRNAFFRTTGRQGPWKHYEDKAMLDEVLEYLTITYSGTVAKIGTAKGVVEWLKSGLVIQYKEDSGFEFERNNFLKAATQSDKICVQNGILDWKSGKVEKWSPSKHLFTTEISGKWIDTPNQQLVDDWNETLKTWIPDDNSRKYLQEYMGYCLIPNCKRRAMTFLEGGGRNGKSMFIEIVSSVFDKVSTNLDFDSVNERFGMVNIVDKMLYVNTDVGSAFIKQTGAIKRVVNGETIAIEKKGQDKFDYTPTGKFLLAANELPKSADKTDGWLSRLNIVKFPNQFEEDPHFHYVTMEKFTSQEGRSMLLSWMVEGLVRLERNNKFTKSEAMDESKSEYKADNDSVVSFMKEMMIEYTPIEMLNMSLKDRAISVSKIYTVYTSWCEYMNIKALTKRNFGTGLKPYGETKNVIMSKNGKRTSFRCMQNYKVNEESEFLQDPRYVHLRCVDNL